MPDYTILDVRTAKKLARDLNGFITGVQQEKERMISNTAGNSWNDSKFDDLCMKLEQVKSDMRSAQEVEIICKDFLKKRISKFENS